MPNLQSSLKPNEVMETLGTKKIKQMASELYWKTNNSLVDIGELDDPFVRQYIINYSNSKYGKRP